MQTVMPGEQDRAPGGVEGVDDRLLDRLAGLDALAHPRDDEQRVVDADAEADQQRELRGERRDRDDVREQPGDAERERRARGP